MANYAILKSVIQDVIKQNGNNEITGEILQQSLLAMVNSLGSGYQFAGIAKLTPTQTDPGTPDQNVFYIAAEPGSYTNFPISGGYLQVAENEVAIFKYNGQWSKETTGVASTEMVNQLGQFFESSMPDGINIYPATLSSGGNFSIIDGKSAIIRVTPGDNVNIIKGSNNTYYSFLTSLENIINGGAADMASGYTGRVPLTSDVSVSAPVDAAYLWVLLEQNGIDGTPAHIYINGTDVLLGIIHYLPLLNMNEENLTEGAVYAGAGSGTVTKNGVTSVWTHTLTAAASDTNFSYLRVNFGDFGWVKDTPLVFDFEGDNNYGCEIRVICSKGGNWNPSRDPKVIDTFSLPRGSHVIRCYTPKNVVPTDYTGSDFNLLFIEILPNANARMVSVKISKNKVSIARSFEAEKVADAGYITCWGDSLTRYGGWTERLEELSGKIVINAGIGGEKSDTILARQGGDVMFVNNITIPATKTAVVLANMGVDGGINTQLGRKVTPLLQAQGAGYAVNNPALLCGVLGVIAWTGVNATDANGNWTFTREVVGDAVVVDRPSAITTNYDRTKNAPFLMIIFMGTNGGYDNNIELLLRQHRLAIAHAKARHIVVLGMTKGSASSQAEYESAFTDAFGRYFINLREYLSQYGLEDQGITPDAQSLAEMAQGIVPHQCLVDALHYTAGTQLVIGNLIYKRCVELNIF